MRDCNSSSGNFAADVDSRRVAGNCRKLMFSRVRRAWLPCLIFCLAAAAPLAAQDTLPTRKMEPAVAVDANGFSLSQQFAAPSVVIGKNLSIDYRLANGGSAARSNVSLEIYFLLENTSLVSAPSQCRRQPSLSGQEILYCEFGAIPAGSSRSFSVTVATSENSRPAVVASALLGELRVDSSAPVVHDTVSDSDGDGISNFIEILRQTNPADAASADFKDARIDVMALYTPAASSLYPAGIENRINQLFNEANNAYFNSAARIRLRPVHFQLVPYDSGADANLALNQLLQGSHSAFAGIDALRRRYGADLVVLFGVAESGARCGLAPVGGFGMQGDFSGLSEPAFGYSWVAVNCAEDLVLAHELGHNMGLTHSRREDGYGGTFDFATGYGIDGEFATIMATPERFSVSNRTPVFSNPDLDCGDAACGRAEDEDMGANAAASLNIVAPQVEVWFGQTMPEMPASRGRSVIGAATSARLGLAAQVNDETGYTSTARSGDTLRLLAEVEVAPEHVGMMGSFHILITVDSEQFHQLDREIGLTLWDGTLGGLRSATFDQALRSVERFHIVDNYEVAANLGGIELQLYLAYQIPGDIIYLPQPLRLLFTN